MRSGAPLVRDRSRLRRLERSRFRSAPHHKRVHARLRRAMEVLRCARDKYGASVRAPISSVRVAKNNEKKQVTAVITIGRGPAPVRFVDYARGTTAWSYRRRNDSSTSNYLIEADRAQFTSFNFTNALICTVASSAPIHVGDGDVLSGCRDDRTPGCATCSCADTPATSFRPAAASPCRGRCAP
jgi:hypothetical protein